MANDPKAAAGRALATQAMEGGSNTELETALNGVQGKVRQAIVSKLRRLVEKDPEAFVRNMRTWMDQGRTDVD